MSLGVVLLLIGVFIVGVGIGIAVLAYLSTYCWRPPW